MAWRPQPRREANRREHHQTTTERGYGWDWQVFAQQILRERPLCEDCMEHREKVRKKQVELRDHDFGPYEVEITEIVEVDAPIITPATEVHHVVKVKHDRSRRLDPTNVLALCGPCHDARTAKGE